MENLAWNVSISTKDFLKNALYFILFCLVDLVLAVVLVVFQGPAQAKAININIDILLTN